MNLRWALDGVRGDPSPERAQRIHDAEVEPLPADGGACRRSHRSRLPCAHALQRRRARDRWLRHRARGDPRAWERGLVERVWVDETRPLLQGARLTAWELEQLGIPHAVIADAAAASLMARGEVDCVFVGADRIAGNGDTANKIGTYALAVLARHHAIPLYVVAPTSTLDRATPTGAQIPIEERDGAEVTTPIRRVEPRIRRHAGALIAAIVTEAGRSPAAVRGVVAAMSVLDELAPETVPILERFGFDPERFESLRARVAAGELTGCGQRRRGRCRAAAAATI